MSSDDHVTANPNDIPAAPLDGLQAEAPMSPPVLEVVDQPPPLRRRPKGPPHPGFWWALLWCVGFWLVTVLAVPTVVLLVVAIFRMILSGNAQAYVKRFEGLQKGLLPPEFALLLMPAMLAQEAVSIFIAWLAIRLIVGREWPRRLALRPPSATHLIFGLFSLPALSAVATVVVVLARQAMHYFHIPDLEDQKILHQLAEQWPLWFGVLVVGLGPGVGEELFTRGFLGRGLVGRHGYVIGVLMTSFFFGLLHMDPALVLATGVMGLWLHFVYLNSRSLLLPMLLHVLNNSYSMVVSALGLNEGLPDPEGTGWWAYAGASALLLCVGWAMYQTRARLVSTDGGPAWQPPFPGVECPPPNSGTVVATPWPEWAAVLVALLGVAAFLAGLYLPHHPA